MIEKAKTLAADEVFLDLEDAVAPDAKAEARSSGRRRAGRTGLGDAVARGAGQRLDHAVDLHRRHRRRVGCRCAPRRHRAAQGDRRPSGARAGPAAEPAGAHTRAARGPDRDRRADRRCQGAEQHRRDRRRAAGAGAGARTGRSDGRPEHAHPGGRRTARGLRRRRRLPPRADDHPDRGAFPRRGRHRRPVSESARRRGVPAGGGSLGGAGLRRQVGAAPRPDRGRQRDLQPPPGRVRPGRTDPGGLRLAYLEGRRRARRGDAGRRDDRRGQPQDGPGGGRQGPRGREWPGRPTRSCRRPSCGG